MTTRPTPTVTGVSLLAVRSQMIGGLARYVRDVARALAERNAKSYIFYAPTCLASEWAETLPDASQLVSVDVNNNSVIKRSLYEAGRLPARAAADGCDVLFYPNIAAAVRRHPVPVVAVLDVMHLSQPNDMPIHKRAYLHLCYMVLRTRRVRVVTISKFSRDDIASRLGIAASRIAAVYCGVDEEFYDDGYKTTGDLDLPDAPLILSVAASYPHKRLRTVVDAFDELAAADPELHLVMAGTSHGRDRERKRLKARIAQSAFRDRIVTLPPVPWAFLPCLYTQASVLIHASQFEGFGFPIAEAMASGTPVAASPAAAVTELMDGHGEVAAGWGASELANAVERIRRWSTEYREEVATSARESAKRRFQWSEIAAQLETEFVRAANVNV